MPRRQSAILHISSVIFLCCCWVFTVRGPLKYITQIPFTLQNLIVKALFVGVGTCTKCHAEFLERWCPGAESNHRHEDFQSTALPLSYPGTRDASAPAPPAHIGKSRPCPEAIGDFPDAHGAPQISGSAKPAANGSEGSRPIWLMPYIQHWPESRLHAAG